MLKKEILETLRQTAMVLCFALAIPIMYMVNEARLAENEPVSDYVYFGVTTIFTLLALSLSWNMFAQEDREGAMEYVRSLPISRVRLLTLKVLPRFALLLLAYLAMCVYNRNLPDLITQVDLFKVMVNLVQFAAILIPGFLIGLSDRRNPVLVLLLLLPSVHLQISGPMAAHSLYRLIMANSTMHVYTASRISSLCLEVLPALLPIALLLPLYLKWQSCSGKELAQKMLKRLIAPTALLIGIAIYAFS